MLFCHITSRVPEDPHQGLLKDKGGTGFPYLVFMNEEGDVVGKHGGSRTVEAFIETGKSARAYVDLKKKFDDGDLSVKADLFLAGLALGKFTFDEAKSEAKKIGELTEEQEKKLETLLLNLEVTDTVDKTRRDPEKRLEAGKAFLAKHKEGKAPTQYLAIIYFYMYIMDYAKSEKDPESYGQALEVLKKKYGDQENFKRFFEGREKELEKLREEAEGEKGDGEGEDD